MRKVVCLAAVALVGCGRVGFDALPGDGAASLDAARADASAPVDVASAVDAPDGGSCATATFALPGASSIVDDFASRPLTDTWAPNGGCVVGGGGRLTATPPASLSVYCLATSLARVHLACDSFSVGIVETTAATDGAQTVLYVRYDSYELSVLVERGHLWMNAGPGLMDLGLFDLATDAWWRLTERDGRLTLATSPDRVAWADKLSIPDPFPLDDVQVVLGAGERLAVAAPGRARFRCVNAGPPCQ